jgi:triphosphoribosyl-dephospho-CoA synthase
MTARAEGGALFTLDVRPPRQDASAAVEGRLGDPAGPAAQIASLARSALTAEVMIAPKPGLVDRLGSGAHKDMDLDLFRVSIDAISPWFEDFARAGMDHEGKPLSELFPSLQMIGRAAESAMFAATGGVNTQKGLVFSLGLLCGAAGYLCRRRGYAAFDRDRQARDALPSLLPADVCATAAEISAGIVRRCFARPSTPERETYGERIYRLYGLTGARGEAEAGFPHVTSAALPLLRGLLLAHGAPDEFPGSLNSHESDAIGVAVLLRLMSVVADTNVLGRLGPAALATVQRESGAALRAGGMFTTAGRRRVLDMANRFATLRISPGGSADLLAVTLFLHNLSN